ncbi:MAG TPA: hypothetical protein VGE07_11675 [Herpetosiphonaceae bacterium]
MGPWRRRRERARQQWQAVKDWAKGPLPRIAVGLALLSGLCVTALAGRFGVLGAFGPVAALVAIGQIATGVVLLATHYPWRRDNFSAAIWVFIGIIAAIILLTYPFLWR